MCCDLDKAVAVVWGTNVKIQNKQPIGGGDINEAYHLTLTNGVEAFLKTNRGVTDKFFQAEANGLKAMGDAGANVPKVLAYGKTTEGASFLLLSYEKVSRPVKNYWSLLGQMLANMHLANMEKFADGGLFGFYEDNFIGTTRQINKTQICWTDFFRDLRLGAQMKLADGYFDAGDRQLCQRLLDRIHINMVPIAREESGLAMSSRNAYLSAKERKAACVMFRSLCKAQQAFAAGEIDSNVLKAIVTEEIRGESTASIDYVDLFSFPALQSLEKVTEDALLAIAVKFGKTRLIDNVILQRERSS